MKIRSSPPQERRDEVQRICRRHGGRLCEKQIYYDTRGGAYALVELPADPAKQKALIDELGATVYTGLVHADEKAAGVHPPRSRYAIRPSRRRR
jgi:hypothetical protein